MSDGHFAQAQELAQLHQLKRLTFMMLPLERKAPAHHLSQMAQMLPTGLSYITLIVTMRKHSAVELIDALRTIVERCPDLVRMHLHGVVVSAPSRKADFSAAMRALIDIVVRRPRLESVNIWLSSESLRSSRNRQRWRDVFKPLVPIFEL